MARRRGDKNQFWDNAATGANGASAEVNLGEGIENIVLFLTTSGATTFTLEVAHQGDLTSEGVMPDDDPSVWFPLFYLDTELTIVFGGAGSRAVIVPDVAAGWLRLRSSNAVTATVGWSATGER